ncbi:HAD family hydrolase [Thermoanaerobacter thermohydrosulfuricus]|uniref:HAD family hydrolase n=1 Tax=Thermoanaerobacter indiensis TaxID=1125974 RepID=UPI00036F8933|nr:HAD family hydrolase [Thermoanaerobacter indiensis]
MYEFTVLDFDGTLFKTETIAIPVYKKVFTFFKEKGIYKGDIPTEKEIKSVMGMTVQDIANKFMRVIRDEEQKLIRDMILYEELNLIKKGYGELYDNVKEILYVLNKSGFKLYIASNGISKYVKSICDFMGILKMFDNIYTSYDYNFSNKIDLVNFIIREEKLGNKKGIMVGDRESDIAAGEMNNLYTVGCLYGYGNYNELTRANVLIKDFKEILNIIK